MQTNLARAPAWNTSVLPCLLLHPHAHGLQQCVGLGTGVPRLTRLLAHYRGVSPGSEPQAHCADSSYDEEGVPVFQWGSCGFVYKATL